jgi:chromosome partitioning protein
MSKAKVISVLNHKGGVGKTTTTINLGGALRQKGYKVLLIDLDGQANLTESLGFSAELPQTIYGAMKGEYDLPIYEHKDGLSVVPSCLDLSAVETELINEAGRELILAHLIKGQKEKFDYILIDCPPSLSLLTLNALTASDRLIIPVQAQFLAMRGMAKLMQVVHKTIYGAMKGEYDLPIYEHKDGLSVVPSCLDLSAVETELINEAGRELILAHLIKGQKEKFDYILIDCPPSLSLLTLNALTASDRLIIPVQAQFLAMRGMAKLMQVVHKVQQRLNSDLSIAGVLITQYDGRKNLNKSVSELVQETFQGKVFSTHIRNSIALAEAPTQGQDIFHYAPKSAGAEDYEKVCNELLTEIK